MKVFPNQKIPTKSKNKQFRVDCVDFIINYGVRENYTDVQRMLDNYKALNSYLDEDTYRKICQNLGINWETGRKFIESYNKMQTVYNTLKGEELSRPFSYSALNISPNAIASGQKEEEVQYRKMIDSYFFKTIEMIQAEAKLEFEALQQGGQVDKKKMEEEMQRIEKKYSDFTDPKKVQASYKTLNDAKEATVNKLLQISFSRLNVPWLKNETWGDAITVGKELVEIYIERSGDLPKIRQLNPLNVFYQKSPDTPFIHDSEFAGYREEMTVGAVLDLYGDILHENDVVKLKNYTYDGGAYYGTTDKMFQTRADRSASSWRAVTDAGIYPSGKDLDPYGAMIIEGKVMGIPNGGASAGGRVIGSGLYSDYLNNHRPYVTVYTVYWKSYRKMMKYSYTDDYGNISEEIVPEDFVVPEDAKRETYKKSEYFGKTHIRKVWYDSKGKYNSVEEIWIPEVWKGVRINGDIYVEIAPLEHAYQSLLTPYETKIPIFGYIYNSRNAPIVSHIDRIMPWQKLYWVLMSKVIRALVQDKGVLTFLNMLMIDKDLGLKKTLQMAEDNGFVPYNPLAHSKGGTFANTFKIAERIDVTNHEAISHYIKLLEFIENQMMESIGFSPQRLAQSRPNTTATDNQREFASSVTMTESMFAAHDLLWEEVLQGYMEMTLSSISSTNSKGKIKGFLNDEQAAIIDLGLLSLEDEYLIKVKNSNKNYKVLQEARSLALSLIQNDKADLSTLITLLESNDLKEFKKELRQIEMDLEERRVKLDKMRIDHEKEMERKRFEIEEDKQVNELDKIYLKGVIDENIEHVRGRYMVTSYNLGNDSDQDGVSDILDKQIKYEELLAKVSQNDAEIDLRREELEQRKQEHNDEMAVKSNETK